MNQSNETAGTYYQGPESTPCHDCKHGEHVYREDQERCWYRCNIDHQQENPFWCEAHEYTEQVKEAMKNQLTEEDWDDLYSHAPECWTNSLNR